MLQTIETSKARLIERLGIENHKNGVFKDILECLSLKELTILRDQPDLIKRIKTLTGMTSSDFLKVITEDYGITSDDTCVGDIWLGLSKLEDKIPSWFTTNHCGWYLSVQDGEFQEWAREFLLQEIIINIWIRYIEDKNKKKDIPKVTYPLTGMYL